MIWFSSGTLVSAHQNLFGNLAGVLCSGCEQRSFLLHSWHTPPGVIDWLIEQGSTSPPTQYRLYTQQFLQVKRPNQQYQSTEGTHTLHGVKQWLHCSTDKNETWRQSLLCGRSSCMEQSASSSSWSWQLVFVQTQAQNAPVYFVF